MKEKVFYTILIYIKNGYDNLFQEYENIVLPLLSKYNGTLELRIKTAKEDLSEPDEIHVISFNTESDFDNYSNDETRKKNLHMFEKSVYKSLFIKGIQLR